MASINFIQEELDLVDIWRIKKSDMKSFTWSQNSPAIFCRLDYWLISNNLQDLVTSTDIIPVIKTDHAAISIQVTNGENSIRGPGYWKMNTSILDEDESLKDVAMLIPVWLNEGRNEFTDNRRVVQY